MITKQKFKLTSPFKPTGDQPQAIEKLVAGVGQNKKHQTMMGVTGSGKTFTVANVIQQTQKPTLVVAHNKTLAAQLYQEFRDFFPDNAVSYFVSYYDYYQPEAYIPSTDTYIEKEATINDEIDKLRLAATTNLLTRPDVIIIASVSCIYNLGSPVEYGRYLLEIVEGEIIARETLLLQLSNLQYQRSETELRRGSYRMRGDTIQLWPAYEDRALKIDTLENKITSIHWIDPISGSQITSERENLYSDRPGSRRFIIYPAKHYVVNPQSQQQALRNIKKDLDKSLKQLKKEGLVLEAYRLEQKVKYDLEMIREFGFVSGIENYSIYFDGRRTGQPPFTLLDYFAENVKLFNNDSFLTIIDESHITLPQIRGMHHGDRSRKETLIKYGFRLPSALDNRPLKFHEFIQRTPNLLYISATPNEWEISQSGGKLVEQLIRPTGLLDPDIELRKSAGQIEDLIIEILKRKIKSQRVLVTTLTKKMAEALTDYLNDKEKIDQLVASFQKKQTHQNLNIDPEKIIRVEDQLPVKQMKIGAIADEFFTQAEESQQVDENSYPMVAYLHSDIETFERSDILADLRRGTYDVVVGINLLREGLDLPEVTLVAILDADKEGFLRSATSLIQTMGRTSRHSQGKVILYADNMTKSMKNAIEETQRRQKIQLDYNQKHNITPTTISKPIRDRMVEKKEEDQDEKDYSRNSSGLVIELNKTTKINLNKIDPKALTPDEKKKLIPKLKRRMNQAAKDMDFELAALIRDIANELKS